MYRRMYIDVHTCRDASLAVYSVRPARTASGSSSSSLTASTAHRSVVESGWMKAKPAATKYFSTCGRCKVSEQRLDRMDLRGGNS